MNFLVIGNITKDLLKTKDRESYFFGGASYAAITALRLGYGSTILTRGNYLLNDWIEFLEKQGIRVFLQTDSNITSFINDYLNDEREQILLEHTDKIIYDFSKKFDIIHINPMYQEIDIDIIKEARKNCKMLSLDVQGLVRNVTGRKVVGRFWHEREEYLRNIDFLKVGKNETRFVSNIRNYKEICEELRSFGVKIVALTLGNIGSIIHGNDFYRIPAFMTKTIDNTGAGDVYGASFAIRYFETKDVMDSALFATASASFVVEDFGPNCIASIEKTKARYEVFKNKVFGR